MAVPARSLRWVGRIRHQLENDGTCGTKTGTGGIGEGPGTAGGTVPPQHPVVDLGLPQRVRPISTPWAGHSSESRDEAPISLAVKVGYWPTIEALC